MAILQIDLNDALLESVAALIAREDTGEILFASPLLEQMFGYNCKGELSIEGRTVEDLLPVAKRDIHRDVHRPAYRANPQIRAMGRGMLLYGQRKDGSTFPIAVMLRGRVIGGVRCVIAHVTDMTAWTGVPPPS